MVSVFLYRITARKNINSVTLGYKMRAFRPTDPETSNEGLNGINPAVNLKKTLLTADATCKPNYQAAQYKTGDQGRTGSKSDKRVLFRCAHDRTNYKQRKHPAPYVCLCDKPASRLNHKTTDYGIKSVDVD